MAQTNVLELHHKQTYLPTSAAKEDSNQPEHPRSLVRLLVVPVKALGIIGYLKCVHGLPVLNSDGFRRSEIDLVVK